MLKTNGLIIKDKRPKFYRNNIGVTKRGIVDYFVGSITPTLDLSYLAWAVRLII